MIVEVTIHEIYFSISFSHHLRSLTLQESASLTIYVTTLIPHAKRYLITDYKTIHVHIITFKLYTALSQYLHHICDTALTVIRGQRYSWLCLWTEFCSNETRYIIKRPFCYDINRPFCYDINNCDAVLSNVNHYSVDVKVANNINLKCSCKQCCVTVYDMIFVTYFLMFNIRVGVCLNFHKKSVTANSLMSWLLLIFCENFVT
jgi:hypothetical protein